MEIKIFSLCTAIYLYVFYVCMCIIVKAQFKKTWAHYFIANCNHMSLLIHI